MSRMRSALMQIVPQKLRAMKRGFAQSFSQYGEDFIFEKLLKPGSKGTYVDVGSHDPVFGSNTYALYRKGWRGITIDPNPAFAKAYDQWRPEGRHLVEGVAIKPTKLDYYEYSNSVFNTFSARRASSVESYGEPLLNVRKIPCRPLRDIVAEQLGDRQIDLLSVDCEGFDLEVIESLTLDTNRPTTIIIEDYGRFRDFRDGEGSSKLDEFLKTNRYVPIAQMSFSALYVALDWEALMARSQAFDSDQVATGVLPTPKPAGNQVGVA